MRFEFATRLELVILDAGFSDSFLVSFMKLAGYLSDVYNENRADVFKRRNMEDGAMRRGASLSRHQNDGRNALEIYGTRRRSGSGGGTRFLR